MDTRHTGKAGQVEVVIRQTAQGFHGYMEHDKQGEMGGLWFDHARTLTDYDGVFDLSWNTIKAIQAAGFIVPRGAFFYPDECFDALVAQADAMKEAPRVG